MGIKIINNFDPDIQHPLDARIVADILTDLDVLVTDNQAYEGMLVYVKDAGAGVPGSYQYLNVATLPTVDLQWQPFSGGSGGTSIHNDLTGIQGGLSNTEHYHLTERQWQWVVDSVPFISPTVSISSNEGPIWAYNTDLSTDEPITLSGSVVVNEGVNVKVRLWDTGNATWLPLDAGIQDANGYVDAPINTVITYTFPSGNYPVDTSVVNGDTHPYRVETIYEDLDSIPGSKSSNLNYVALRRLVDEVWSAPDGTAINPTISSPDLNNMDDYTAAAAWTPGINVDLSTPGYVCFVVSNDLTGGDASRIAIYQGPFLIYQFGSASDSWGEAIPYTGDASASAGFPTLGFIQVSSRALIGGQQTFNVKIL